jgi:hypothetical protein
MIVHSKELLYNDYGSELLDILCCHKKIYQIDLEVITAFEVDGVVCNAGDFVRAVDVYEHWGFVKMNRNWEVDYYSKCITILKGSAEVERISKSVKVIVVSL